MRKIVIIISGVLAVLFMAGCPTPTSPAQNNARESNAFSRTAKIGDFRVLTLGESSRTLKMIYVNNQESVTFPTGVDDAGTATLTHQFWMGETEVTNAEVAAVYQWAYDNYKFNTPASTPRGLDTTTAKHGGKELLDLDDVSCHIKFSVTGVFSVDAGYANYPVTEISWYGAVMFCNWLTEMRDGNTNNVVYSGINSDWKHAETKEDENKNGYRLPSSMEWEYTARYRGTDTVNTVSGYEHPRYTTGNSASGATGNDGTIADKVAVYGPLEGSGDAVKNKESDTATATFGVKTERNYEVIATMEIRPGPTWRDKTSELAVKTKAPNALGLYDMSGNVWEWCSTRSSKLRVMRGGSWGDEKATNLGVGKKEHYDPSRASYMGGFRLCRTAD